MGIEFAPAFVEEVVRHELERRPESDVLRAQYRRLLDEIYHFDESQRAISVERIHRFFFSKLGWPEFFAGAVGDLAAKVTATAVLKAEGVEGCFVNGSRALQIRLNRTRFLDRDALRAYLRHELTHVADILNPEFGYREERLDEPTRIRYGKLWCSSIDARVNGRALEPATHDGLLNRARAMGSPKCPICQLPAARLAEVPNEMAERMARLFPRWSREQCVCERCVEWTQVQPGG